MENIYHQESALLAGTGHIGGLDEQLFSAINSAHVSFSDDSDTSDVDFVPGSDLSDSDLSKFFR